MPISELYVVQHLMQETLNRQQCLVWKEKESEGYSTIVNGVSVDLFQISSRLGSRLFLLLSEGFEQVPIAEPLRTGFVRPRYPTQEHEQLAHAIRKLAAAVARQCENRRTSAIEAQDAIRESIFRRLLFADSEKARAGVI